MYCILECKSNSFLLPWSSLLKGKTTDQSQVTDKLYHIMLYRLTSPLATFELTMFVIALVVTDCICSCRPRPRRPLHNLNKILKTLET